ncbi:MAG: hypothetical protein EZS28_012088 [Streblomastix strix]|uniref:Uncharacterized protein n=1 Tax=Streblomastix strix TaxID=222440 RepID=A0A5J4WCJ4_9EUKA|nr:MAG: hypothetical protein EZS28_012088 [Streblomastix strix]
MKLQRTDSGKQFKFHSYIYNRRFRHHYETEIQILKMRKNLNEKSKPKDHENIMQKFIIDVVWRTVYSRKKGEDFIFNADNYTQLWALIIYEEEKDIEVVMEEPLMRYNSCTSKKYKKKEIVRVDEVLIKNVSIFIIDIVLRNSIEKLYRVKKDFVRLSDQLESDIGPEDF